MTNKGEQQQMNDVEVDIEAGPTKDVSVNTKQEYKISDNQCDIAYPSS